MLCCFVGCLPSCFINTTRITNRGLTFNLLGFCADRCSSCLGRLLLPVHIHMIPTLKFCTSASDGSVNNHHQSSARDQKPFFGPCKHVQHATPESHQKPCSCLRQEVPLPPQHFKACRSVPAPFCASFAFVYKASEGIIGVCKWRAVSR